MDKRTQISELGTQRAALRSGLDALLAAATEAKRELTDEERAKFDTDEAEIRSIDARIKALDEQVRADEAHAETMRHYGTGAQITREPQVYTRDGQHSYFRDLFRASNGRPGAREAAERLERNDRMVAEQRTGISTTNGSGGEFVPPLWLEEDFVKLARPGRITANLIPTFPLPAGTDSINIPKINTGTAVAIMNGQNVGVNETDLTTTSVSSSVFTIAGGQTVSLQLIEQSPINIDGVVLQDLAASYAVALDTAVLTGSGASGNPTGIMTLAGTNAVDVPNTVTSGGLLYPKIAHGIELVHTLRYMPADHIIMHPRRWAWLLTQLDSQGRPLVVPAAGSQGTGFNLLAEAAEIAAQGYVGTMLGLPVYVDANIPTNLTADTSTNEDAIIVARLSDLVLWEGNIRAEAFQQTYANQMSVYVRLYNYGSFQAGRYPQSISVLTGAGLGAPTF